MSMKLIITSLEMLPLVDSSRTLLVSLYITAPIVNPETQCVYLGSRSWWGWRY